jgi:hypothetical protein
VAASVTVDGGNHPVGTTVSSWFQVSAARARAGAVGLPRPARWWGHRRQLGAAAVAAAPQWHLQQSAQYGHGSHRNRNRDRRDWTRARRARRRGLLLVAWPACSTSVTVAMIHRPGLTPAGSGASLAA